MAAPSDPTSIMANPIAKGSSLLDGSQSNQWYPTVDRLQTPEDHAAALKQVLDQHYALQRKFEVYAKAQAPVGAAAAGSPNVPPAGSGPTDTMLLGLRVVPVDVGTLANGATLKWNKDRGQFEFV